MMTGTCGHEVKMVGENIGNSIAIKEKDRGEKVISYIVVCDKCLEFYKKYNLILSSKEEEDKWMERKEETTEIEKIEEKRKKDDNWINDKCPIVRYCEGECHCVDCCVGEAFLFQRDYKDKIAKLQSENEGLKKLNEERLEYEKEVKEYQLREEIIKKQGKWKEYCEFIKMAMENED